jgi:hypothetical protein
MDALLAVVLTAGGVLAGDLTPPGPPGSTMYTLEDIYLAVTGDANVVNTTSGDAVAGEILSGKKAWAKGQEVTGTMANVGMTNMTPGTVPQMIPQGYHDGTGAVAGDGDLVAGNIKKDVVIFGVTGTHEGSGSGAGVPKTGQTTSYRTRDDGELEKGVTWPNPRFTDHGDTVTDNLTGLMWSKSTHPANIWNSAIDYCNGMNSGAGTYGYTDWRLPNVRELLSLIDYGRYDNALPSGHPFTGVLSGYYWSSSMSATSADRAWVVRLADGYSYHQPTSSSYNVLPVRGGQ